MERRRCVIFLLLLVLINFLFVTDYESCAIQKQWYRTLIFNKIGKFSLFVTDSFFPLVNIFVLVQVSIYLQNWSHVLSYVSKAQSTTDSTDAKVGYVSKAQSTTDSTHAKVS